MHASAMAFAKSVLTAGDVEGQYVAEAGARDYNGTVRPHVEALGCAGYLATDLEDGPGVDIVLDAAGLPDLGGFGVVICTEMLEHAEDWQAAMYGLVEAVDEGGILVITTRGPGFGYHPFPGDYWRYTLPDMDAILTGAGLVVERLEADEPSTPGVLAKARKPAGWAWPPDTGWDRIRLAVP